MASIPSIALIPSGYKASKLYSVLPTNGNADLTVVRNSTANRINKDGLIESMAVNVPLLDHSNGTCPSLLLQPQSTNLITYPLSFGNSYWTKSGASIEGDASTAGAEKVVNGDFATDTDWNKNTNWTISAGAANADGTSNGNINQGADDTVIGATFIVTYDITSYTSGTFYPQYGGVALTPRSAVGTYAEQVTTISNLRLSFRGALPLGSIDNLSVKEVQGFSSPSVDNPTSAFKLVENTSTGVHKIQHTEISTSSNNSYSVYFKPNGITKFGFRETKETGYYASFDLTLGTVIDKSAQVTASVTTLNNGWSRCVIHFPVTASTIMTIFTLNDSYTSGDPAFFSYTGDGTSGVYIFGAQLEALSYPTSLMLPVLPAVEGTSASRLKDEVSRSGLSAEINSVEGTLFVEMAALADDETNRWISVYENAVSTDNQFQIRYASGSNLIQIVTRAAGLGQDVVFTHTLSDITASNKIAVAYNLSNFSLYVNGVQEGSTTTATPFTANSLDTIDFQRGTNTNYYFGNIKDLRVYKTALTDAELTTLTTI